MDVDVARFIAMDCPPATSGVTPKPGAEAAATGSGALGRQITELLMVTMFAKPTASARKVAVSTIQF